jgi:hypothetical protein
MTKGKEVETTSAGMSYSANLLAVPDVAKIL